MKKLFLINLLFFTLFTTQSQTLAKWDFEQSTGAPSVTPSNGTASNVTVNASQTASFFAGYNSTKAISTTGFPSTSTPDLNKYFEFTIAPNSGFILNISEISFFVQRSNTGATGWVLRSSLDNYATNIATNTIAIPTVFTAPAHTTGSLTSNTPLQSLSTGITFRLYGVSASGTSGTMRVDDLTVNGTIVTASNNPLVTTSTTSLAAFSTNVGTPSTTQNYSVAGFNLTNDISITAPLGFEISLSNSSGFNSSLLLTQSGGSVAQTTIYVRLTGTTQGSFSGNISHVSTGATTKNVSVTGSVNVITPTISVSLSTIPTFGTTEGTPSTAYSYTISGSNLSNDINVTAPTGFEISLTSNTGFNSSLTLPQSGGNVAQTTIYTRLTGVSSGSYSGNITHTSTGATTQNVAVTGTVNPQFNGSNYLFLRGNFHSHTGFSDGNQDAASSGISTPAGSFSYARLSNQIDFWGISEHNHSQAGMNLPNFAVGLQQAINETTTSFTALLGHEYGVISNGGHCLVYGVDSLIGWESGNYQIYNSQYDYAGLFRVVNDRNPKAWVSLAHPQSGDFTNLLSSAPYSASADSAVCGIAIRSGSAFSTTTNYSDAAATLYEVEFKQALAKGYHVAPEIDHDNHNTTFGRTVKGRTVVLSTANNKVGITEAIRARRFYASDDWNLQLNFTVSGKIMGSVDNNLAGNPSISVSVTDPDNETVSSIELWYGVSGSGTNVTLLTSVTNSSTLNYVHNIPLNSSYYYYAKVRQGDNDLTWSAPIWITKTTDVVPIELISFKAELQEKEKSVLVVWDAEQTGASEYIIERSIDGNLFVEIGKVKGAKKAGAYHYSFTDNQPSEGFSYYRLKQIDENGISKYSNIVSIFYKHQVLKLKALSPNPTSDFVNVTFDSEKSSNNLAYFIYDADGRAVLYQRINVAEGENNLIIDVQKLPIGLYYLNIGKRDDRMIQTKFIKY
ncbi:MAG: T9SS type A sorting domain-containing protein [Saprospiraceae bacterium]|nr:T9SS type A sorting domain-containing protein [Saprospiraceae bacterium]